MNVWNIFTTVPECIYSLVRISLFSTDPLIIGQVDGMRKMFCAIKCQQIRPNTNFELYLSQLVFGHKTHCSSEHCRMIFLNNFWMEGTARKKRVIFFVIENDEKLE